MIALVLIVCLSATSDACHEERPIVDLASPMAYMVQGQQIAAEWIGEHPKWELHGWKCQVGKRQNPI